MKETLQNLNLKEMIPSPPRKPEYRIKEFKGIFTIEKLFEYKEWVSMFPIRNAVFDFLFAYSIIKSNYKTLSNNNRWWIEDSDLNLVEIKTFKTLKEAQQKLKEIISEEESKHPKYHNI